MARRKTPRQQRTTWQHNALVWLMARSDAFLHRLAGGPVDVESQRLDAGLGVLVKILARSPAVDSLTPDQARQKLTWQRKKLLGPPLLTEKIEERRIETADGEIRLRIYTPPNLPANPAALVYYHGGGWVYGDLETHNTLCTVIAQQVPCKVVSVDYRLAPEHPFPAAVDDALAAWRWVHEHAAELKVDDERIGIGGDSAGGNLAAVVCQQCRDEGYPMPRAQWLIYPVTDGRCQSASYEMFATGFGLTRATMKWFYDHYLGPDGEPTDPRVSPLLAAEHRQLPPAVVVIAGFDVLRDEGLAYAEALRQAGVEVCELRFDSMNHAFVNLTSFERTRKPLDEAISELARQLRDRRPVD